MKRRFVVWKLVDVEEIEVDLGAPELVRIELFETGRGKARRYRCRFLLQSQFELNVALHEGVIDGVHLFGDFHAMQIAKPDLSQPFTAPSRRAAMTAGRKSLSARLTAIGGR